MDSHMLNFTGKQLILSTFILSVLLTAPSCRSTIKEPTKKPLYGYNQIDTLTRGDPDSRGIITYDTYQILVANGEETIAQIATRLDIGGEKLALYNGLISNYRPRVNEIIAIPETQFISSSGWSTEITQQAIQKNQFIEKKVSLASNPLRHRVKEGETIYSVAREYNVSVNSLATWNGLGPDLDIKTGREIIIPAAAHSTNKHNLESQKPLLKPKTVKKVEGELVQMKTKKSSLAIKIENRSNVPIKDFTEKLPTKAKTISVRPFIAPVEGNIANYYAQDKGSNNNNGVDYATKAFETVRVVSDGTVVLISDIVGGNGKIVLVRHQGQLITIYGRLTNILVKKGQNVNQGEKIGEVIADPQTKGGLMHFEVRKGMQSIDPETMIQ
jgi:lipoprotein NlpD